MVIRKWLFAHYIENCACDCCVLGNIVLVHVRLLYNRDIIMTKIIQIFK